MSNERKPGALARKARAAEQQAVAESAADLSTMLGEPHETTLWGRVVSVYPVTLGRMKRFGSAMQALGQMGLFMLVEDRPDMLRRLNETLRATDPNAIEITADDAAMGLKMMMLQPEEEQVDAMIGIAEAVLNGEGQSISREEIEGRMLPMEFAAIYRLAVTISGLNP